MVKSVNNPKDINAEQWYNLLKEAVISDKYIVYKDNGFKLQNNRKEKLSIQEIVQISTNIFNKKSIEGQKGDSIGSKAFSDIAKPIFDYTQRLIKIKQEKRFVLYKVVIRVLISLITLPLFCCGALYFLRERNQFNQEIEQLKKQILESYRLSNWLPKPVIEEPVVQKSIVQEPVVKESIVSEPIVKEPIVSKPIVQEPVVKKEMFQNKEIDFLTFKVLDQSSRSEWKNMCGYHALKNAIALGLINYKLGDQSLLEDESFYQDIYHCINGARPINQQGQDIDIATLHSFLHPDSYLDVYIKKRTNNKVGIEELAKSMSLFNYEHQLNDDHQPIPISNAIELGSFSILDRSGLSSLYQFQEMSQKIGKPHHPFIHNIMIGGTDHVQNLSGHWITLSIVQDDKGNFKFYGMDSWKNKTNRYEAHLKALDYVSQNPEQILLVFYKNYMANKMESYSQISPEMHPLQELQLLLDNRPESLASERIQNLVCQSLDIASRDEIGAKYVLQRLGFPVESMSKLSEEDEKEGLKLLEKWGFPKDPSESLNPDPIKAPPSKDPLVAKLRTEENAKFKITYKDKPEQLRKDYPQHYFFEELLWVKYGAHEKIKQDQIATKILQRGVKHNLLADRGTSCSSIFENIQFMHKAGWLKDETAKKAHAAQITPLKKLLEYYLSHDKENEKIKNGIVELS